VITSVIKTSQTFEFLINNCNPLLSIQTMQISIRVAQTTYRAVWNGFGCKHAMNKSNRTIWNLIN